MNHLKKNWIWFLALMGLILGAGVYLGASRRAELGKSFAYELDEYLQVDPALIHYVEIDPLIPTRTNLSALAIASDGTVWVAGHNAIESLPAGKVLPVAGTPDCLAVDGDGTFFIGMRDHILRRTSAGTETFWLIPSENAYLTSVAVGEWYCYAADAGSRRIWRFDRYKGGEPLEIGKKDWFNGVRGFFVPSPFFDLAVSRSDLSLWAVNPGHHALENYRPDGMPLSSWERSSMMIDGFSGCCNPSHFALMPDGAFVTAEKGLPRVKIHEPGGALRCVVAAPDQFDEGVVGLDVAVDAAGRIYVLDPSRNQVRIFERKKR